MALVLQIRNMVAVLEVISSLEKYPITKEALEVSVPSPQHMLESVIFPWALRETGWGFQSQSWGSIHNKMPCILGVERDTQGRLQWLMLALGPLFAVAFATVCCHPESFPDSGLGPSSLHVGASENAASGPGTLGSEDCV